MNLKTDWNSSTSISASCIEGMFKMTSTETTMSLFESRTSGGQKQWRLLAIPEDSSNPKRAKIKFELNTSNQGSGPITSNNVSTETSLKHLNMKSKLGEKVEMNSPL